MTTPTPDRVSDAMVCGDCGWRGSTTVWRRECKGFPCELRARQSSSHVPAGPLPPDDKPFDPYLGHIKGTVVPVSQVPAEDVERVALDDAFSEALRAFHYETFRAGVCYERDEWPQDDEEWRELDQSIQSEAVGEHFEGWADDCVAKLARAAIAALQPPAPRSAGVELPGEVEGLVEFLNIAADGEAGLDVAERYRQAAETILSLQRRLDEAMTALKAVEERCHMETRQGLLKIVQEALGR